MTLKKNILAIIGSASDNSSNKKLVELIIGLTGDYFNVTIFNDLKMLPHFDPMLSENNPPQEIAALRSKIENADGLIICTPEYVFSLPSGLKNLIEWCVSTTVFSEKPTGLITASAGGERGHEELKLAMKTVMAKFTEQTTLLISGIKGKFNENGALKNSAVHVELENFIAAFKKLVFSESV